MLPAGDATRATSQVVLTAELATQPRALRPAELIGAVWPAVEDVRVLRTHQWIERDGARSGAAPIRRDGRVARAGACVMRREPLDVRTDPERRCCALVAGTAY